MVYVGCSTRRSRSPTASLAREEVYLGRIQDCFSLSLFYSYNISFLFDPSFIPSAIAGAPFAQPTSPAEPPALPIGPLSDRLRARLTPGKPKPCIWDFAANCCEGRRERRIHSDQRRFPFPPMAPLTMSHAPVSDDEASLSSQHSDADSKSDSIGHSSGSESLDSQSSRKRRKLSPLEDDDDGDEPFIPRLAVPSRTVRGQPAPLITTAGTSTSRTSTSNGAVSVPTDPQVTFAALDVKPWLVGSLGSMAIKRPTGIQKLCIPEILKGRDCIGGSRTGSGKTMAFAVPILQKWAEDPFGIFALVLTPTRYEPRAPPEGRKADTEALGNSHSKSTNSSRPSRPPSRSRLFS